MKTLFDQTQTLPGGLWLVKWIDRFSLGRGFTSSPRVRVFLQRLPLEDVRQLDRLSQQDLSYLIGKRPGSQEPVEAESRDVMAGLLPLLRIGDVVRERQVVGQLRQREATITLEPGMDAALVGIYSPSPPPKDWGDAPHRVLNRFEYELGGYDQLRRAQCLRVATARMEYLIPATVVLRTFYAFHTKVANAMLSGRWDVKYRDVISTLNYASGIGTYIDPKTGDWHIVVQPGLTREHAVRLALLLFDDYARQCANAIHSTALRQTHGLRADDERFWFAEAQIPFRWTTEAFKMRVKGFPLRPLRPSDGEVCRFLVTRIEATSWPLADQVIHWELANSNALSPEREGEEVDKTYYPGKPPAVPAKDDAEPNHESDAFLSAADNQVAAEDFWFLNPPLLSQQVKRSHKEYRGAESVKPSEPPSPILSAGNVAPGVDKPAPLVADSKDRHPCRQLQFLLNALEQLVDRADITGFEVLGPPEDSHLRIMRNNVACWSFLTEEQTMRLPAKASGWSYLFDRTRGGGSPRRAYARCLLVILVTLGDRQLLLFEVEPRLLETGYRLYLCEPTEAVHWTSIETALLTLRAAEGRLDARGLVQAFKGLSTMAAMAVNHSYERDAEGRIIGLSPDTLHRAFMRVCVYERSLLEERRDAA